jgi:MYXO-CTERM domain-containing protein
MKDESVCVGVGGNKLSEFGDVTLTAKKLPDHPPNDHCDTPQVLTDFPAEVTGENYSSRAETLTEACPTGEFALWYSFTAPEDGWFKFDTKLSTETSPDIALYATCGGAVLECSGDPLPAVSRQMTKDETVLVRLSTNVFLRSPMVLRVGPEHEDVASTGGSAGAPAGGGGTGGEGALGGSSSGGTAPGGGGIPTGQAANGTSEGGGCGCRVHDSRRSSAGLVLSAVALALAFRRRRCPSG